MVRKFDYSNWMHNLIVPMWEKEGDELTQPSRAQSNEPGSQES